MYIDEISLLEEFVDGVCNQGTHAEYGLEGVGSRTQMGDGTHVLQAVTFLLQRIIRCGSALDGDLFCLDLEGLFCFRSRNQSSFDDNGSADVDLGQLLEVCHGVVIYDLQGLKKSTVVQYQETEGFGITVAPYPATDLDFFV